MPLFIAIVVFVGVAALIGGVAMILRGNRDDHVEGRLEILAHGGKSGATASEEVKSLLANSFDEVPGLLEQVLSRVTNVRLLIEQANASLSPPQFVIIAVTLFGTGVVGGFFANIPLLFLPLIGLTFSSLPFLWLLFLRKRRRAAFGKQLPEALELIARALRAGHSLGAGIQLVGDEMSDPLATEFTRVFEEQNLGVPLEEAMDELTDRIPNLDLRFFATAVVLQRQTGGDLAEILDKLGELIRERFKIFGQIQALTGEGRISGLVLLALPPALFGAMLKLNYDYIMILFEDPIGHKLLAVALVMQVIGALVIRKIVNIRV